MTISPMRARRAPRRRLFALAGAAMLAVAPLAAADVRIVQTNSRDDVIHLIDPASHSVVGEIKGIPVNHGVAAAPDGSRLYFSSEAKHTLDVVDARTLRVIEEIPLTARPHNISIGKDGRYVYIGIMEGAGGIDVVDTEKLAKVRHIDTGSRVHNTYVTPDGRHLVAGTFGGERNLSVFDVETEKLAFALFARRNDDVMEGVRPIAFEKNPDGSTKRMFVQLSEMHGFAVVDFAARREVGRIMLPELPPEQHAEGPFNAAPAHGIGVAPDGKTLWVCSRLNGYVYAYSLPELEYLGGVAVGSHPDWLTFTPDSRFVYVANGYSDDVSVVEIATMQEVKRLGVGKAPKRNLTVMLP
jgi:YVTN family beta-propeller protein